MIPESCMYKGIIHAHSTYSDGEYTLSELREALVASGCSFVCMTEHAEFFDANKLSSFVNECATLSDDNFLFIPGLEYNCERRMHVLGYGVTALVNTDDPQQVIAQIKKEGGVSVIAHPMDSAFPWIESFAELPRGIETWNSKYDGRYAPRPQTFSLLQRLQLRAPEMTAFYGVDFHWRRQFRQLYTIVNCSELRREKILEALMNGMYAGSKNDLELPSTGQLSSDLLSRFGRRSERTMRFRRFVKRTKKLADRFGASVPAPIKAQLRRIF
jgi:predicted metal-dependent phosphoesterase TrpH